MVAVWGAAMVDEETETETDEERAPRIFGKWLRQTRDAAEMSQEEFGRRCEIPQSEVSKWERGLMRIPPPEKVRKMATALGVPYRDAWSAVGGIWPNGDALPAVVRSPKGEVIPELVALLNLSLSPQEAHFLASIVRAQRRYMEDFLPPQEDEQADDSARPSAPPNGR